VILENLFDGIAFDYIAGIQPYAPSWMRKLGLEWLYRLCTQPRRWHRIFTALIRFPWAVFLSKLKNPSPYSNPRG